MYLIKDKQATSVRNKPSHAIIQEILKKLYSLIVDLNSITKWYIVIDNSIILIKFYGAPYKQRKSKRV